MSLLTSAATQLLRRQFEHRFEQPDLRVADGKLRGVDPYGQAARACRKIVAEQCPLAALIKPALRVERERTRGDGQPLAQPRPHLFNTCHLAPRNASDGTGRDRPVSPSA